MLGLKIKEVRKNRKITLKRLGEQTNLSTSFLCDVEKGRTNPSVEALQRIAKELETSIGYLLGEDTNRDLIPQSLLDTVTKLSSSKQGIEVLEHLSNFDSWNDTDKQELLKYLEIKNLLRNAETGA